MIGFALLVGHLVGDYLFQDDWQASNKTNPTSAGNKLSLIVYHEYIVAFEKSFGVKIETFNKEALQNMEKAKQEYKEWISLKRKVRTGHIACTVHCLLYTFAVFLFCFWFLSWWAYPIIFATHWPVDRFRLARKLMRFRQESFATGPFSPWSIIVVDNTIHLVVLYLVAIASSLAQGNSLWTLT